MNIGHPSKVLITSGRGVGGVDSFAEGLRAGFSELGIPVEIIRPSQIFSCWHELRDARILKILSTTAVLAAPAARRAICMAHGVTRAKDQSTAKMAGVVASFRLSNASCGTQLIAVSEYVAAHLETIFNVRIDSVIHNPVRPCFLDAPKCGGPRNYITYVGVLEPVKNVHRLLPAIRDVLDDYSDLRACIAGNGSQQTLLRNMAGSDGRIEFTGWIDSFEVRERLRRTAVFISGTPTEALGIAYVEALSQGCAVTMPASGGSLELALETIGSGVQLFSLDLERSSVISALRKALSHPPAPFPVERFAPSAIALRFLEVDTRFSSDGRFRVDERTENGRWSHP